MKVELGTYSKKQKGLPKVIGPKRRVDRRALAEKVMNERAGKKKGGLKKFLIIIFLILIFAGAGAAIWKFNRFKARVTLSGSGSTVQICDNILNPKCWTEAFKPTFKQTDGFTNALLVGIDTRPVGDGSDLMNTDTIIIASVNHETKKAMLISIPRDMLVPVKIDGVTCCTMKINSIYSLANARDDVDDGMQLLASNIENLLGIEIHYTGVVNFEAVKSAVDAVGGVEIDIKDDLVVTYPEEEPPYNYQTYSFDKGLQTLDGKHALVYSRFRYVYSGPSKYASDFSRAERQQTVIDALKEKVLADQGSITDLAQKYWRIYQSISDNVTVSEVSFEDALAGFSLINDYDKNPINVVLDPNFGGINTLITTGDSGSDFGYHIKAVDNTWASIRTELSTIWNYPEVFDDKAVIVLSNRSSGGFATDSKAMQLESSDIPFKEIYLITESKIDSEGVVIYDFSEGEKQRTVNFLKEYFGTENVVTDPEAAGVTQTGYLEDIKIEFGPEPVQTDTGTN